MEWKWDVEKPLGRGGFGHVYEAWGPSGPGAAKVVKKATGGDREQLVVSGLPHSRHIIPVLQVEETEDSWVLFMPRAELSLRDRMFKPVSVPEAITILKDIAQGLAEVATAVVHRDLKPENILFLDGAWALCDFGIARYIEATTAPDTLKDSMTAPYAAPEQWRFERATSATDVYAFGIIAYELLSGHRPFTGTREQIRMGHLTEVAPMLEGPRKLAWLVNECLGKAPEARPSAANITARLARVGTEATSPAAQALGQAQSSLLAERAEAEAAAAVARTEAERRENLVSAARSGYEAVIEEVVEFIRDSAPDTSAERRGGGVALTLGGAQLRITPLQPVGSSGGTLDVVAASSIELSARGRSRGHSLYFGDFDEPHHYVWYEMGFMQGWGADFDNEPRALPGPEGLSILTSRAVGGGQLGWGISPLDPGDPEDFVQRWATWFGLAAQGKFPRLSSLPDGRTTYPRRRY
ncbi:serine/threonine-protein kinase [Microbacterium plantarum]|uniref:serine/threonine-protein kinase n=1 Tax=Microbacterium plantarum TaxID=1816425 RepID=UPI002B4A24AA|nr:serine/threonine-protein kinase [Microbacterium plantarum]WRK17112.1 serine/threonine-protein kinase [Microbacterium plantarum]